MKKDIKLYNILFPIWLLWLFPSFWIIIVPINLTIEVLVQYFSYKKLGVKDIKGNINASFLRVFLLGIVSDALASLFLFLLVMTNSLIPTTGSLRIFAEKVYTGLMMNPFTNITSLLLIIIAIAISTLVSYKLFIRYAFDKANLDDEEIKYMSRKLAIFSAPYFMLIPTLALFAI